MGDHHLRNGGVVGVSNHLRNERVEASDEVVRWAANHSWQLPLLLSGDYQDENDERGRVRCYEGGTVEM